MSSDIHTQYIEGEPRELDVQANWCSWCRGLTVGSDLHIPTVSLQERIESFQALRQAIDWWAAVCSLLLTRAQAEALTSEARARMVDRDWHDVAKAMEAVRNWMNSSERQKQEPVFKLLAPATGALAQAAHDLARTEPPKGAKRLAPLPALFIEPEEPGDPVWSNLMPPKTDAQHLYQQMQERISKMLLGSQA